MSDVAEPLVNFLTIAGPVIGVAGALVALWSALKTRRKYYDDYMKNRSRKVD